MPTKRLAIIADSHFDEHSRFDECTRLHHWIAGDMERRGVDAVVHCGDVYERKSTPLERAAVVMWVERVTSFASLLVVRGNHDAIDDLPLLERLRTKYPVIVEQQAGIHEIEGLYVAAVAWPRKSALLAATGAQSKELGEHDAANALRSVLRGLGDQLSQMRTIGFPVVLAAHAMVRDSVTSTGQPLVGCDLEIGLDDLALVGADIYALGHIHKGQSWEIAGAPCVYPGSPRRTAFGEVEAKGYILAEWDGTRFTTEFIEAPATPMLQWDMWFTPANPELFAPAQLSHSSPVHLSDVDGAEVRVRYEVTSEHRDAARELAHALRDKLLEFGATHVKLEESVSATVRARTPQVAAAVSLSEKLEALWVAQRFEPGARREALLAKVNQLQESAA